MSDSEHSDPNEMNRPIETTGAQTVDSDDGTEPDVVDDAGGVFMPTRKDGQLAPVERESDKFREPIRIKPTNQSIYDRYLGDKQDVRDLSPEEWAGYISEVLVEPDPQAYAQMYGKPEVNARFIRENLGGDQRREIAALSLESGGYSAAAANARGEMTEQEKQNMKMMLGSDEVEIENLASMGMDMQEENNET